MAPNDRRRVYWDRIRTLTSVLLAVWFGMTFGITFFARDLTFTVMGWPFSYYMSAQGCLVVYLLLTLLYATRLRQLDVEYGVEEVEDE
jgi:putative solute:sodium symporter small subunit